MKNKDNDFTCIYVILRDDAKEVGTSPSELDVQAEHRRWKAKACSERHQREEAKFSNNKHVVLNISQRGVFLIIRKIMHTWLLKKYSFHRCRASLAQTPYVLRNTLCVMKNNRSHSILQHSNKHKIYKKYRTHLKTKFLKSCVLNIG